VPVVLGQGTGQGTCTAPDSNTLCLLPTFTLLLQHPPGIMHKQPSLTLLLQHPHQHHVQTALFNTAATTSPPASCTNSPGSHCCSIAQGEGTGSAPEGSTRRLVLTSDTAALLHREKAQAVNQRAPLGVCYPPSHCCYANPTSILYKQPSPTLLPCCTGRRHRQCTRGQHSTSGSHL